MSKREKSLVPKSLESRNNVVSSENGAKHKLSRFREKRATATQKRRIMFAYDATGSRADVWQVALTVQARLLDDAMAFGDVEMMLVAYRDRFADPTDFIEHSDWSQDKAYLQEYMARVSCHGGGGNDGESIDAALEVALSQRPQISALVLVGDEPAVSESRAATYDLASSLGANGIPVFAFHEGDLPAAKEDFLEIARRSKGVYEHFTAEAKLDFGDRLRIATVFATGGKRALDAFMKLNNTQEHRLSPGAEGLAQRLLKGSESPE